MFRTMPLTRLVVGASAGLIACALAAGIAVGVTEVQFQRADDRNRQLAAVTQANAEMLTSFVDEETGYRGYLLTGDPVFLAPYDQAQTSLPAVTNTLQAGLAAADGPALLAQNLQAAHDAWSAFARQQLDRVASGDLDGARTVAATGQGKALFDNIRARDEAVASWLAAASASTDQQASALRQRLMALLVLALITLVGVVAGGCYVLWTAVARPLARLAAATRAVVGGDLAADLPAVGAVEVRSLSRGVGAMRDRLTADLHTTRKSLEALEQTEPTVAALRTALRPFNEHVPGLTVQARLDPAEGVLAGDWYDTIALDSSRLGLVLGDVAGHGPAAAVFALRLKHSLITALRAGLDPGQALTQVCGELADVPAGQFATALVAIIDTKTQTITYANAGHPAGLLLDGIAAAGDPGHASRQTTRLFLDGEHPATWMELPSTGPLLSSIVIGWAWNTSTEDFCPGDTLLTFTDGVLETRNQDGEEFGTHGILDTVTAVGTNDGHRLIEAIAAASMRFGGNRPRRDDHTLVYLHRVTRQPHTDTTRPTAPR